MLLANNTQASASVLLDHSNMLTQMGGKKRNKNIQFISKASNDTVLTAHMRLGFHFILYLIKTEVPTTNNNNNKEAKPLHVSKW